MGMRRAPRALRILFDLQCSSGSDLLPNVMVNDSQIRTLPYCDLVRLNRRMSKGYELLYSLSLFYLFILSKVKIHSFIFLN